MREIFINFKPQVILATIFLAVAVISLALRKNDKAMRYALTAAIASSLLFLVLIFFPYFTITPNNYSHYYFGAKYKIEYADFYAVLKASSGAPMEDYRDLRGDYSANAIINDTRQEKLAYYASLLDAYGVKYPPQASPEELKSLCFEYGLFERYNAEFLKGAGITPETAASIRADLANAHILYNDKGFNGSPFYVMARHLDPSVYFPLSINSFRFSVLLELIMLFLSGIALKKAFEWETGQTLLFYALTLSSWEFTGWNLLGLVAMGWFLPSAVSLYYISRGRFNYAAAGIAVATLIKIFPALMALPAAACSVIEAIKGRTKIVTTIRFIACLLGSLIAGILFSQFFGSGWGGWLSKISTQFTSGVFIDNNVSLSAFVTNILPEAPAFAAVWAARAIFIAAIVYMVIKRGSTHLSGIVLFSIAAVPWLTTSCPNYYALASTAIACHIYKERPYIFTALIALFALSQWLTDTHLLLGNPALLILKNSYYLAVPAAYLYLLLKYGEPTASRPNDTVKAA